MQKFGGIYNSEEFKALDPGDQIGVRDRFFETQVAPMAKEGGFEIKKAQDTFNKKFSISQNISKRIKGAAGEALGSARGKLDSVVNDLDRDTGINHMAFRGDLSTMTGIKEKTNFLNTIIGKDNWVIGNRGENDFAISTQAGLDRLDMGHLSKGQKKFKPIAIDEDGLSRSDFIGDTRGAAVPMLGGILGGVLTGGVGFVPGMLAAGGTAAAFKGLDELRQTYQDKGQFQLQSAGEVGKDMAVEGALAATGEGVGRLLRPLGRIIMGPNRQRGFKALGKQPTAKSVVEPARRKAVSDAQERGVTLPITQATGRNKLLGFFQRMTDTVFGNPRAANNAKAINKWAKDLTGTDIGSNISKQKFGEGFARQFTKEATKLKQEKVALTKAVRKKMQSAQQMLRGGKNIKEDGELGESIRSTISSAHDDFIEASSLNYAAPLMKVGGGVDSKIFSSAPIRAIAKNKLATMMKTQTGEQFSTATGAVLNKLKQFRNLEETVSFNQLTALRKDLGKAAYTGNIHSDVASHDAMEFLRAIDGVIDNFAPAGQMPRAAGTGRMVTPKWQDAIKGFREANKQYNVGIKPFKDSLVQSITKDVNLRGAVQPSMVVNAMKGATRENVAQMMGLISRKNPALAKQVRAQFFDDVIWNKTVSGQQINAGQLAKNIAGLKPGVLEKMYKGEAQQIRRLASQLDEFGHGTLQVDDVIHEGGVASMLGKLVEKTQAEDAFLKSNFASIAQKGSNVGGSEYGKIIDLAMKDAGYAKELIAMSSPQQLAQGQNIMMRNLINKMVDHSDPITAVLNGKQLQAAMQELGAFTAKEGDNSLKIFLGPEKFEGLKKLARVAALTHTGGSSGLVAMSIALQPFSHLGRLAEMTVMGKLMIRPTFVNWMTKGFKGKTVRPFTDNAVRSATQFISSEIAAMSNDVSFQEEMEKLAKEGTQ